VFVSYAYPRMLEIFNSIPDLDDLVQDINNA
jgi:hypothetical protein